MLSYLWIVGTKEVKSKEYFKNDSAINVTDKIKYPLVKLYNVILIFLRFLCYTQIININFCVVFS